ncbi:MAG: response regulator [Lachnospiraceae bacterium]|nr:response regulator [Lachnospiraceae bacterium]
MEKILIVDDEEWIVEGLKLQLPWEAYGIELTSTAQNGKEAIEILEKENPSIVLTDIRMPMMDGLELAKYIYTQKKDCELIIISGYADFEYAKKAIAYGVSAYLTKPVIREELAEAIQEILEKLCLKREQKQKLAQLKDVEEYSELSQYYLMENQCQEKQTENSRYITAVFYVTQLENKSHMQNREEACFLRLAKEMSWNNGRGIFFNNHFNPSQYVLVVDFEKNCKIQEVYERIESDFAEFLDRVRSEMNISGIIGVSTPYDNTNQSFKAYLQAKFIVENLQGDEKCRIVPADEFGNVYGRIKVDYDEIQELMTAIECRNRKGVEKEYGRMTKKWEESTEALICTRLNIQEILVSLSKLLTQYNGSMYELGHEYADIFAKIWSIDSCHKLVEQSKILIEAVMEHIDTVESRGKESVIIQIKKYIDNHYSESITLNEISRKYYINAAYFSRAFKREIGINFNDYLRKLRLDKAAAFLASTDLKIYEIAGKVGFDNPNYFMKKFQEQYGITPGKYREKHSETG